MLFGPIFQSLWTRRTASTRRSGGLFAGPNGHRRPTRRSRPAVVEALDPRQLMATLGPAVAMVSATTRDSLGVTVSYKVESATPDPSITFGVYRSTDANYSADDVPVQTKITLPSLDANGQAADTPGVHTVTLPLADGLPLNPEHPYVVVTSTSTLEGYSTDTTSASFRKHTVAIITHGGLQGRSSDKSGVPWAVQMAKTLKSEGYDVAIPFNWSAASRHPGKAAQQAPRLVSKILAESAQFPAGDPVDFHFIGHSEGAVVNTQAIAKLQDGAATSGMQAGYWEDTLLDPHAANPDFSARQYSVGTIFAPLAKFAIDNFQAHARDPIAYIPSRVNSAQVFYQQTPANRDHGQNHGLYNLWGEVPVRGEAVYFNLTPSVIVHSGKNGVYSWYQTHVAKTLGNGDTVVNESVLRGKLDPIGTDGIISYSGTSAPGSRVAVRVSPPNTNQLRTVGVATTDADGDWEATIKPLPAGKYRVVAVSRAQKSLAGRHPVYPSLPLGGLTIQK